MDHARHLVGLAEAPERQGLGDLLGAGRQDRGVHLARRDRVDAHAQGPEVVRHLARQRLERGLRGRVGGAREGVHLVARDRGDVDHRALRRRELGAEPAGQHHRSEEVDVEHLAPGPQVGGQRGQPLALGALGRDARVVDERVEPAAHLLADRLDGGHGVLGVGEVHDDVVGGTPGPGAALVEGRARAGQHAPPLGREALDGGVPDPPARARQQHGSDLGHRRAFAWHGAGRALAGRPDRGRMPWNATGPPPRAR